MATTTNYGWGTPDDTDLVKDGALAIRDLGQDIDTTTKALNPETTTGDIAYRSATANTNTRLALGTAGQVLTVNSGATAPEWATPAGGGGGGLVYTGGATFTTSNSVNIDNCFSATYENYIIFFEADCTNTGDGVYIRYRASGSTNTTSNFYTQQLLVDGGTVTGSRNGAAAQEGRIGDIHTGFTMSKGHIQSPFATKPTLCWSTNVFNVESVPGTKTFWNAFNATTSFTGLNIWSSVGTMTGTARIYGLANS